MPTPLERVDIDYEKLSCVLKEKGISKRKLSLDMGRNMNYINNMQKKKFVPVNEESLICRLLEMPPGSFIKAQNEADLESVPDSVRIIENFYREIKAVRTDIDVINKREEKILDTIRDFGEALETILRKISANTVQLEKLKEYTKPLVLSNYEKTVMFLKELLADGKMQNEDILKRCDERGLNRADVYKAKKEIGIETSVTGYGKNQKTWWFI